MLIPTALLACGPETPETTTPEVVDPLVRFSEPGPFRVGYAERELTWSGDLQAEPRTLRLATWFPTDATEGLPVTYLGAAIEEGVLGGVEPTAGPLPVAIFSHGHQGYAENSGFLMEHLASHGWLVLAPDHTGNTTFDGGERETSIYWQRPLDLAAVLDDAASIAPVTDEVVAIGHSFGGYTMHAVAGGAYAMDTLEPACADGSDTSDFCSTMDEAQADRFREGLDDPRVAAVVSMAPGDFRLFGDAGIAAIDRPELLLTGGHDPSSETDGDAVWAALDGADDRRVHLPTAGHPAFTDFSGLLGDPPGSVDPETGWRAIRTYALAFVELHGRGDAAGAPLLDGEIEVSPEALLELP